MKNILIILSLVMCSVLLASNSKELIAENAKLELIFDQFAFTEGPASDTLGNVYFTDIPDNTIYVYTKNNDLQVFMRDVPGNGLAFDNKEKLIVCGHNGGRNIYAIDILTKEKTTLIEEFSNQKFNSPNDLWIDAQNGIYFTDPRYGKRDNMELNTEQVYYLSPDRSKVIKVTEDLRRPNGIYGIDNGEKLLIADNEAGIVYIYNVKKDGSLTGKKKFIVNERVDGMTVDQYGNIYITSENVKIYNNKGLLIEEIKTPEHPTNVCFGGADFKTLYITERKKVYKIKMNVMGARY